MYVCYLDGICQAAKETSVSNKNYKETRLAFSCCRQHPIVFLAVNMFVGETYRAHFLNENLYEKGNRVLFTRNRVPLLEMG